MLMTIGLLSLLVTIYLLLALISPKVFLKGKLTRKQTGLTTLGVFVLFIICVSLDSRNRPMQTVAPVPTSTVNVTAVIPEDQKRNEEDKKVKAETDTKAITPVVTPTITPSTTKQEEPRKEKSKINTSVFAYAKSVNVTDARDITKHIDLIVNMSEEPTQGLVTQHVFTQSYDFLQQEDIKGAETVTIGVMHGKIRVAQITVDIKKFVAGDHFVKSVLEASKIDKMNDEVKKYGKTMELW